MPKGLTFLASAAVVVAMSFSASAESAPSADTVVARVNGEEITLGHMIIARATLPAQYQEWPDQTLYDAILDQLIQQSLLKQAYGKEAPKRVELQLENERRSLLAGEMVEIIFGDVTNEDALQAAYDAKYSEGFGGDEYNASHILVETEEEAKAIKADLDGGADFAETAKAKSTGPSGPNGGSLGWFGPGRMVAEFEAAVVALQPGEVSDPVKTQFGWHLVILNEKRKAQAPKIDDVRGELLAEVQQQALLSKVEELTADGDIERIQADGVAPDVIKQLDLIGE